MKLHWVTHKFELFISQFKSFSLPTRIFLIISIVAGSYVRLVHLGDHGFFFDMVETQYSWGKGVFDNGLVDFWRNYSQHYDYPILSLLYETGLIYLSKLFLFVPWNSPWQSFVVLHKLSNWFVEIIFITFVLKMGRAIGHKSWQNLSVLGALIYILPSFWFVSGVWGQNDSLMGFLSILVLYLLWKKHNFTIGSAIHNLKASSAIWNDTLFWAGVLWAISIQIKQQPILLLPVVFLFFAYKQPLNKLWRALSIIGLWLGLAAPAVWLYNTTSAMTVVQYVVAWFTGGVVLFAILSWKDKYWRPVWRFLLGFVTVQWLSIVPFLFINYERVFVVTLAAYLRKSNVSFGAMNVWTLIQSKDRSTSLIIEDSFLPSIKTTGFLLAFTIFAYFVYTFVLKADFYKQWKSLETWWRHSFSFEMALWLMTIFMSVYFMLMTGGHSRYLHMGLQFSVLAGSVSQTIRLKKWLPAWIIINLGYFLNQVRVFTYDPRNSPQWPEYIVSHTNFELDRLGGILMIVGMILLCALLHTKYIKNKSNEPN
jgi:hypothetical protein